jgi:hypothetical protein
VRLGGLLGFPVLFQCKRYEEVKELLRLF